MFQSLLNGSLVDDFSDRWVQSETKSDYGKFTISAGAFYGDSELDKGKVLGASRGYLNTGSCNIACLSHVHVAITLVTCTSLPLSHVSLPLSQSITCTSHTFRQTGLKTTQDAKFYAASATFDTFSNEEKTLVVQFTVKHEQKIDCGGGYVKVREGVFECWEGEGASECWEGEGHLNVGKVRGASKYWEGEGAFMAVKGVREYWDR